MTGKPRPALQLYSVRSIEEPLPRIIHRVADCGYDGVEFAYRFREESPAAVAAALDETGLEPVGVHAELPTVITAINGTNDLIDRCQRISCEKVILPHTSPKHFQTHGAVRSLVGQIIEVSDALDEHDIRLGIHNVRHCLWPVLPDIVGPLITEKPLPTRVGHYAGRIAKRLQRGKSQPILSNSSLGNLLKHTDPEQLFLEVEVAEMHAAGVDPVAAIPHFADRIEMIHLRDIEPNGRIRAWRNARHGEGVVETDRIVDAAREAAVSWIVFENELDADPKSKINEGAGMLQDHLSSE
jgi:sugar phosphate isomerase/epimerase